MAFDDPLSTIKFNNEEEDDAVQTDFDTGFHSSFQGGPIGGTSGRGISSGYAEPEDSEAQHFGTMRYDQVFGQDSPRSVGVKPEPSHAESSSTPVEVEVEDDVPTYGSQAPAPTTVITVTDPQKHAEQSIIPLVNPGFYTYKVITRSSQDNFRRRDTFVRRRFRDCVDLYDRLKQTHRGYFIPPRPKKNPVEGQRATQEFLEHRRVALEKWLNQLAAHPVIGRCEDFTVWLESDGPLNVSVEWNSKRPLQGSVLEGISRLPGQLWGQGGTISAAEASKSTKNTGDLLRSFKELATSMKADYKTGAAVDSDEADLRGEKVLVEEFEERVAIASRKAEKVVSKFEELGGVLGDLGLSLVKLAKFEDETGSRTGTYTEAGAAAKLISSDTRRIGMVGVRLSRAARSSIPSTTSVLSSLHHHLGFAEAVTSALKEREGALLTVQTINEALEKKGRAVAALEEETKKVFGGDQTKNRKVVVLQNDIAALEAAHDVAQQEYDRVKSRNVSEMANWKQQRSRDFKNLVEGLASVESQVCSITGGVWQNVVKEF